MSDRRIVRAGSWFNTEVSNALFKLSGASIVVANSVATVTLASHLLTTGDYTTYSGATGQTAFNASTWGPVTVTSTSVYTFPVPSTFVSPTGTIVQEKLYFPPAGQWVCILGANGQLEYDPGNLYGGVANSGLDITWRILIPASTAGDFNTDGYAMRFRENGTTATSFFSQVN